MKSRFLGKKWRNALIIISDFARVPFSFLAFFDFFPQKKLSRFQVGTGFELSFVSPEQFNERKYGTLRMKREIKITGHFEIFHDFLSSV